MSGRCLAELDSTLLALASNLKYKFDLLKGVFPPEPHQASDLLKEAVLLKMQNEEVKYVIMQDELLLKLGEEVVSRNALCKGTYTSARLRRMGRLMVEVKKIFNDQRKKFIDFINPQGLDILMKATIDTSRFRT